MLNKAPVKINKRGTLFQAHWNYCQCLKSSNANKWDPVVFLTPCTDLHMKHQITGLINRTITAKWIIIFFKVHFIVSDKYKNPSHREKTNKKGMEKNLDGKTIQLVSIMTALLVPSMEPPAHPICRFSLALCMNRYKPISCHTAKMYATSYHASQPNKLGI